MANEEPVVIGVGSHGLTAAAEYIAATACDHPCMVMLLIDEYDVTTVTNATSSRDIVMMARRCGRTDAVANMILELAYARESIIDPVVLPDYLALQKHFIGPIRLSGRASSTRVTRKHCSSRDARRNKRKTFLKWLTSINS